MTSDLHVVWPSAVHDPQRPSGGNVYDREAATALAQQGVRVHEHPVDTAADHEPAVAAALAAIPDGSRVLVDGLVGLDAPDALTRERDRLNLFSLVHLPLSLAAPDDAAVAAREARALAAATGVITTSTWTRRWLLARFPIAPARVVVAPPGVVPADLAPAEPRGSRLLCSGPVTAAKGQDLLVDALAGLRRRDWSCRLVGATDLDPSFVADLRARIDRAGLGERVRLGGALTRAQMDTAYDATDLLVVPSRLETYGMAISEALARGIPVIAAETGGVTEAMGSTGAGRPGLLLPTEDPRALQVALTRWLADGYHRGRLRRAAAERRLTLPPWSETAERIRSALQMNRTPRPSVVTT